MIKNLIEGKYYKIADLELLIGRGYLSLVRSRIIVENEHRAKFNFVGLVFGEKHFCYVLPKYFRGKKEEEIDSAEIDVVQESLLTYGRTAVVNTPSMFSDDGIICSAKLQAATNIVSYYFEKGLLAPDRQVRTSSFDDKILWEKTIELTHPVISNNIPIYVEPISTKSKRNEAHLITEIQKWISMKSFDLVGKMMFPSESLSLESNCSEEETEYYVAIIEGYLQNIYSDDEVALLKNFLWFLKEDMKMEDSEIEVFGTKAFHRVWELANKILWQDQFESLKTFIPYPVWEYNRLSYKPDDTIIPDILYKTDEKFFVVDAKYYLPVFIGDKPSGQPGVESITKQYVYEDVLKAQFGDLTFVNIFCFPDEMDLESEGPIISISDSFINGKVNFETSPYNDILNVYLPPKAVLKNYNYRISAEIEL